MTCDLHLVISGHGYGHAAQVATVVRALRAERPSLTVTVQSAVPRPFLAEVIGEPFYLVADAADIGLVNRSAFEVDVAASAEAYRRFHADLGGRVAASAAHLDRSAPRLLLSDVPYVPLLAARRLGIPAVAFCSLNWADVYEHYLGGQPESAAIASAIRAAYAAADLFLVPEPGMPMPGLGNLRRVGPCAAQGRDRRAELAARCGAVAGDRLVMVAVGGLGWTADYARWPEVPGVRFVVQAERQPPRPDMLRLADAGMPAIDVMASVDAVVGKLGYSLPVEAAVHGKPMLFVPRDDWPETPWIAEWMLTNATAAPLDLEVLRAGALAAPLARLFAMPRRPPVPATGPAEAAKILLSLLR